jgi:DNA-binding sugar fermentation-stimulating protein
VISFRNAIFKKIVDQAMWKLYFIKRLTNQVESNQHRDALCHLPKENPMQLLVDEGSSVWYRA